MVTTEHVTDAITKLVTVHYDVDEPEAVHRFLEEHDHLAPLLLEMRAHVSRIFGPTVPVRLKLIVDPEGPDKEADLVASIRTSLPIDEAVDALDRLDETWWLEASGRGLGLLILDIEAL